MIVLPEKTPPTMSALAQAGRKQTLKFLFQVGQFSFEDALVFAHLGM